MCWLKNGDGGWQFRCPGCLRLYAPWIETSGRIPAQKVLCLSDNGGFHPPLAICDEKKGVMQLPPFAVRGCVIQLHSRVTECILTQWPDTSTENLINTLKAATLGILDEARSEMQDTTSRVDDAFSASSARRWSLQPSTADPLFRRCRN